VTLEALDHSTCSDCVGDAFILDADSIELELTLAAVTAGIAPADPAARTPFSLIFDGPSEPLLGQAIYRLEHPQLGTLEIFIVPIGCDAGGARYEAVFS